MFRKAKHRTARPGVLARPYAHRSACWALACALLAWVQAISASDLDEFKVKRQDVFEFAEKPRLSRNGDNVEIAFASKGFCDVTVAVENMERKIVRHFVSGVLGPHAPEPFQKNALAQTIVWDGKDDKGKYIDDKDHLRIRVSLGLKPAFEKNLFWEPKRRLGSWEGGCLPTNTPTPLLHAAPEGVYVFEGQGVEHLLLFDHAGNYLKTVYPFSADKLAKAEGLNWQALPQDGQKLPRKTGYAWATFLTSGSSCVLEGGSHGGGPSTFGSAATAMAIRDTRIALTAKLLNRLSTDGTTGGLPLEGPTTSFPVKVHWQGGVLAERWKDFANEQVDAGPTASAFSPDGKWLYMTGFFWSAPTGNSASYVHDCFNVVMKLDYAGKGEMEVFAGSSKQGEVGAGPDRFFNPVSIACDAQGRVYVADYLNDRVQIFSPEGKLLKSIPTSRPARVRIHRRTGEIYIFSWNVPTRAMGVEFAKKPVELNPVLTRRGPFEDPRPRAACPLPLRGHSGKWSTGYSSPGLQYAVELDAWTDPPTLWMLTGSPEAGIQLYVEKDGQLVKKRDFGEEAKQTLGKTNLPAFWRQRLYANPKNEKVYLAEGHSGPLGKMFREVVEIDPESGKNRLLQIPFDADDLAFDADGMAYMRDYLVVGRYDPADWREVPWDYGEEKKGVSANSHSDRRTADLISALPLYSGTLLQKGGLNVSPKGNLIVSCYVTKDNPARVALRTDNRPASLDGNTTNASTPPGERDFPGGNLYTPRFFPGRYYWGEVHVFDKHGKMLYDDVIPGITELFGVAQDRDDNVYVLSTLTRVLDGQPYFNEKTGTLMKFKPQKGLVMCNVQTGNVPIRLSPEAQPKRPPDLQRWPGSQFWVEGAEWKYGGVGFCGKNVHCSCWNTRFALDYFARSFVAELDHFSVAVLDTKGNLVLRVGKYGNADSAGPNSLVPLDGDGVGFFYAPYVATLTDRRLLVADPGNQRIVSVKLNYHTSESIPLAGAPATDP